MVKNANGDFVLEYRIFVDDLHSIIPRHLRQTRHFITPSIESVYILLGYPGPITKPDLPPTMSWDKMADRAVGPDRLSLGVEFLYHNLEMTVDNYKVAQLLELLNTEWSSGRKYFTALAAAVLTNNVYTATLTYTWLRWTLHQLIAAMKVLIRTNYYRLARTKYYDKLHAERDELWLDPPSKCFARRICPNLSIMKEVWRCSSTHFITKAIHTELKYV